MADQTPINKQDPIEAELTSDDPQASRAAQGVQTVLDTPQVQQALDFGGNLDAYKAMITAAMAGDPEAQQMLAQHSMGVAMGTIKPIRPLSELPYNDKVAATAEMMNQPGLNATEQAAMVSRNSAEMDKAARLAAQKKDPRPKKAYADGGDVIPDTAPQTQGINVINPEGELVSIPHASLADAVNAGYQPASQEQVDQHFKEEKYGGAGQQIATGLEGAAQAATFGLSAGAERALGVPGEDILARREMHPGTHMLGEVAGLAASSLIPGLGEANLLGKAGEGAAAALKLGGEGASTISKIGAAAVDNSIQTMMLQAADENAKLLAGDPNQTVGTAMTDIGLSGLIGGGLGGALGSVNPLWHATEGSKVGRVLSAIKDRVGGIEGVIPDAMTDTLAKTGMDIAPEIRAGLSSHPEVQQMFKTLEQSDTTGSGLKFQEAYGKFRKDAGDTLVKSLGATPEELGARSELSKYEAGKQIGHTLADEFESQVSPLSKEYDALADKYKGVSLQPAIVDRADEIVAAQVKSLKQLDNATKLALKAQKAGDTQGVAEATAKVEEAQAQVKAVQEAAKAPGTTDQLVEKVSALAQREGWNVSPSGEIMREVNRVLKEIPNLKTLKDLKGYIQAVGDNMQSDPLNGPLRRAGGMIKGILRDSESELLGTHIGSEEGADALERYAKVRAAYSEQSQLREALDSRLHAKGSTSGYAKSLKEMAQTDGESVLRRLSGNGDADLLQLLQSKFPKTAEMVKKYHIDNILQNAADKAKPGETIRSTQLLKDIQKMSPELKQFTFNPEQLSKIQAVGGLLEKFEELPHNFSNTARTADKLMQHVPGSVVGLATMLLGHGPIAAAGMAYLTKILSKDAPDAARLALLKFLGSSKPIEAGGFKAMTDFMTHVIKGEALVSRAAKNLFKAGVEVLPQSQMPTEQDRKKLNKKLEGLQTDQNSLLNAGGKTAHYLPDHGVALAQTASSAVNYLNSLRPNTSVASPFDTEHKPSQAQTSEFNRALDIAQQPLIIIDKMQKGTLVPQDLVHLKNLYPGLYERLNHKLMDQMMTTVSKGETIPYKTRMGMSMFMGQPLDSTMTPASITAAQPQAQQAQQQPPTKIKRSTSSLSKLPSQYRTPNQARQLREEK